MKTHVALVLDSSGSMDKTIEETISGFNEQLDTFKEMQTEEHKVFVTLTTFATKAKVNYVDRPLEQVERLSTENYQPSGWTAMYDGVGASIVALEDGLEGEVGENDAFWVWVLSDGQENNSKEYTSESLAAVINRLKATGKWTFSYMGSNQDLSVVQRTLGVANGNVCQYSATKMGTETAFSANRKSVKKYFTARASGACSMDNLYSDHNEITDAETVDATS